MKQDLIRRNISDSISVKQELLQNDTIINRNYKSGRFDCRSFQ